MSKRLCSVNTVYLRLCYLYVPQEEDAKMSERRGQKKSIFLSSLLVSFVFIFSLHFLFLSVLQKSS